PHRRLPRRFQGLLCERYAASRCSLSACLQRFSAANGLRRKSDCFSPRCNRNDPICFSPYLYRARDLVERFFNKIQPCLPVATRYDKLAANYLAFVQLVSIMRWLRVNESTS